MIDELLRRVLFLPPQRSTVSLDIDRLHYFVILVTMAGAVAITLIGGYFLVRYRRQGALAPFNPDGALRPPISVEVGFIALLVVLFLAWWFIGLRQYVGLRVAPPESLEVYVTAKQWMWKFSYAEGASSISTLYVPANRPVKLIMTSRDVIHSFFVPDFRIKQDVIPGRYTTVWFEANAPGRYDIFCAEYCGTNHSTMRGEVVAMSAADFERWLAGRSPDPAIAGPLYAPPSVTDQVAPSQNVSLVRVGLDVAATQGCLSCHTTDGSPHIGPTWAGTYGSTVSLTGGGQALADEAYLTESMMDPLVKIRAGFEPAMPTYWGRLDASDVAALVELIKSLREVRPMPTGRSAP